MIGLPLLLHINRPYYLIWNLGDVGTSKLHILPTLQHFLFASFIVQEDYARDYVNVHMTSQRGFYIHLRTNGPPATSMSPGLT